MCRQGDACRENAAIVLCTGAWCIYTDRKSCYSTVRRVSLPLQTVTLFSLKSWLVVLLTYTQIGLRTQERSKKEGGKETNVQNVKMNLRKRQKDNLTVHYHSGVISLICSSSVWTLTIKYARSQRRSLRCPQPLYPLNLK
jgi:hypothetical protein